MIEPIVAPDLCNHTDGYGSTVMPGGLCLLCERTILRATACEPTEHQFRQLATDLGTRPRLFCAKCGSVRNIA